MKCPICNFEVSNLKGLASHFRHHKDTHPDYNEWSYEQKWKDKVEGNDYVVCLECGEKAETLARHLKASHGITAEEYKKKHGELVLIRTPGLKDRRSEAAKNREAGFGKGETKIINCPDCGMEHEVSKFFSLHIHNPKCLDCQKKEEKSQWNAKWANLSEPEDYVTCKICGYRAENLCSHIQNAHPNYRDLYPDALIVALKSEVRNKDFLKGKHLTEEIKKRMSESAGKWNLGLTKETDKRIANMNYSREDVTIRIEKEILQKFALKNGKIAMGKAIAELGYGHTVIKRECLRHQLPIFIRNIKQNICLKLISNILNNLNYISEWISDKFKNPKTGFHFKFDGYFPDIGLVVEFYGYQHYTFPNFYLKNEQDYLNLIERDRVKKEMIENDPDLKYFEIREDEPYADISYIKGKLIGAGILKLPKI